MPSGALQDDICPLPGNVILFRLYPVHVGPLCRNPVWPGVSHGRYPQALLCCEFLLFCGQGAPVADDDGIGIVCQG